ncbi:MAG: MCP four helix bundle domain-containing protein, partial [Candidatus Omnitrophica bacterium]|nr:MCP four helix bundle domain-containing protein [Candidatus Omnitrophota bacterium]
MKKSFRRNVLRGFGAMVCLCVFLGVFAFLSALNIQKVFRKMIRENVAALKAAEELQIALLSQKGFVANYFLSGDAVWIEQLEVTKADFAYWFTRAAKTAVTVVEKEFIAAIDARYAQYEHDRLRAKQLYEAGDSTAAKQMLLVNMRDSLQAVFQKCEEFISVNESIIEESELIVHNKIARMVAAMFFVSWAALTFIGAMFILLVRKIIHSMEQVRKTARSITLTTLSGRVQDTGLEEETVLLAQSFNEMLGRLERSFEYIKEFSASIGHELKTPLAIIKGEAEIALRRERPAEEYRRALSVAIDEANRMIRIVEDLVFLTKLDYNSGIIKKEKFDFSVFFADIDSTSF